MIRKDVLRRCLQLLVLTGLLNRGDVLLHAALADLGHRDHEVVRGVGALHGLTLLQGVGLVVAGERLLFPLQGCVA